MKKLWNKRVKCVAKKVAKAIETAIIAMFCVSCSSTRASILTAKDSATTTITITTNNPVSATTDAKAELNLNGK